MIRSTNESESVTPTRVKLEPEYHTEQIDGHEIQKPTPNNLHAFIQSFAMSYLRRNVPTTYAVLAEMNVLCGGDRLVPDLLAVRRGAHYSNGDLDEAPTLAIEIFCPGQTIAELIGKADRFLKSGTPLTWIIWPEKLKAWTYTENDLSEGNNLVAHFSDSQGLTVNLNLPHAELWACLDQL